MTDEHLSSPLPHLRRVKNVPAGFLYEILKTFVRLWIHAERKAVYILGVISVSMSFV